MEDVDAAAACNTDLGLTDLAIEIPLILSEGAVVTMIYDECSVLWAGP